MNPRAETDACAASEPSMASLVGGIVSDANHLIQQQFMMFRAEMKQELRQLRTGAISLGIGLGIAIAGVLLLLVMLVHLLADFTPLPLWGCYGVVGGVLAAVGGALALAGRKKIAHTHLVAPPQTAQAVKENVEWLKRTTTTAS